jgi:N6-adenosine-specific RNA methylase IME4
MKYATIYADPPWPEHGGGKSKRGADRHYPLMSVRKIKALPVGDLAAPDAHLWLWSTGNYLADAIDCARAWGFRYVTFRPWVKADVYQSNSQGVRILTDVEVFILEGARQVALPQNPGLGQYMRCDAEILLFCVRGMPMMPKRKPRQTIYAPRGRHSAKPACVRADIERMSPAPRLELFARERHEGWDAWGNEVQSDVVLSPVGPRVLYRADVDGQQRLAL